MSGRVETFNVFQCWYFLVLILYSYPGILNGMELPHNIK